MARAGFVGPVTVLEGQHGFFKAFAPTLNPDFAALREGLGSVWAAERLAFKPYACGTMTQPYVDCAVRLRRHLEDPLHRTKVLHKMRCARRAQSRGQGQRQPEKFICWSR